jgi:hypothetical protein
LMCTFLSLSCLCPRICLIGETFPKTESCFISSWFTCTGSNRHHLKLITDIILIYLHWIKLASLKTNHTYCKINTSFSE